MIMFWLFNHQGGQNTPKNDYIIWTQPLSRYAHAHIICTSSLYPAKEDMSFLRTHLLRYRQRLYLQYPSVMYWRQMTVKSSNKSTKWLEDIIHVSICLAKVGVQLCYGKYWKAHTLTVTSLNPSFYPSLIYLQWKTIYFIVLLLKAFYNLLQCK